MRLISCGAVAGFILMGASLAGSAHAQYGPADPPTTVDTSGAPAPGKGTPGAGLARPRNNTITFYPFAEFRGTASNNNVVSSNRVDGSIIALESGWVARNAKQSYALGAWSFFRGDAAIIEAHAKYYFTERIGFQAGLVGATKVQAGLDSDYFVILNLSPKTQGPMRHLKASVGLGAYAYARNSAQFTGFAQASFKIKDNVSLDASYWYVGTPAGNLDRVALGGSYKF